MRRVHTIVVGSLLLVGCVIVGVVLLAHPQPAVANLEGQLQTALISRSVSLEAIEVSGTNTDVKVTIRSGVGGGPDSVWIRALVEQEMNRLKFAGATEADWVTVVIVDQDGQILFGTQQSVEGSATPKAATIEPAKSAALASRLTDLAQVGGIDVKSFAVTLNSQDTVATVVLVVDSGEKRDAELLYVVQELLPRLREAAEKEQQIPVTLYRISMQTADGQPLVEYVVDASRGSVRAWMADDVRPVWSYGQPQAGDAAK